MTKSEPQSIRSLPGIFSLTDGHRNEGKERLIKTLVVAALCILIFVVAVPASAAADFADAKAFWRSFREAVVSGNPIQVALMTRFPFEVRGVDDSDPVKRYTRQTFPNIFAKVVSQKVIVMTGKEFLEKSMLQVIREKSELTAADMATPDFFTVEVFNFHFIKGRWHFTRAYLEAP